jgi:hypothetical protein
LLAATPSVGTLQPVVDELVGAMRGDNPEFPVMDWAEDIKRLLGPAIATRMAEASQKSRQEKERVKSPAPLALAVMMAAASLERLSDSGRLSPKSSESGRASLMSDEGTRAIGETLERHLKDFLVPDWQQRRADAEVQVGAEELAAEMKRRA